MIKAAYLLLIILLSFNFGFSQTKSEINLLLNTISKTENSINLINLKESQIILDYEDRVLLILSGFYLDSTLTNVKSTCHNRNLTKGEIAIILADHIKQMPYALLTGVQNCLLEFCENNPNFIEFYLPWIEEDGGTLFKQKYLNWLRKI